MKRASVFLAIAVVLSALSGPAWAVKVDRDFHESFEVRGGFRLDLHHGDGDVTITPWDKDVIDITVRYRSDVTRVGLGGPPDFEVEFKEGEDFVRVIGRMTPAGPAFFQSLRVHEYAYTIQAPSYVVLKLDGDDGDIEITGWRADVDCSLDDGDLLFDDVANSRTRLSFDDGDFTALGMKGELRLSCDDGDVRLSSCEFTKVRMDLEDGDVTATDCTGEFSVSVDDGDVSLALSSCREARVRSADGDVEIAVGGGEVDEIDVATDDGDVFVSMPVGSSYSFLITMDDGRVRVNVPEREAFEKDENAVSGKVRGGRGRVRVRTNDGNVLLQEG
ncbi:MAG: DUF4097 family beta strand repeat-containing protein [Candidatus Eisenbacteria bacterium]